MKLVLQSKAFSYNASNRHQDKVEYLQNMRALRSSVSSLLSHRQAVLVQTVISYRQDEGIALAGLLWYGGG